ncbi:MAG: tetratricopeptide repeat protein [Porphyrobacter sp.]|nr:tetratricopeptide repeat protein [Porphyrobacter sp.]
MKGELSMYRSCNRMVLAISVAGLALYAPAAAAQDSDADAALDALSAAAERPETALATASQQEAEGDLLGAASTLERALIENPQADDVRLAYAGLLCRLDDPEAARAELSALRSRPASGDAWQKMIAVCGEDLGKSVRPTGRIGGSVSIGLAYDEDAFGELNIGTFFGPGSTEGLAFVARSQINAQFPVGDAFVYGDLFGLTHNSLSGPESIYQFGDAAAGFGIETGASVFSAGALVRHGRLFGDEYLTALGAEARASFRVGDTDQIALRVEAVDEEFNNPSFDGWHYTAQLAYERQPTLQSSYFVALAAETKDAPFEFYSYDAFSLAAGGQFPLHEAGIYGTVSSTLRYVDFQNNEFGPGPREWRFFARAGVGMPLIGRSLFLEGAARYRTRDTNRDFIQTFSSFGGDLTLVWRF